MASDANPVSSWFSLGVLRVSVLVLDQAKNSNLDVLRFSFVSRLNETVTRIFFSNQELTLFLQII